MTAIATGRSRRRRSRVASGALAWLVAWFGVTGVAAVAVAAPAPRARLHALGTAPAAMGGAVVTSPVGPVIYDNTGNASNTYYDGQGGHEALDDLHMTHGGTLDTLTFEYYDPGSGTFSATVNLYGNPAGLDLGASPLLGSYPVTGLTGGRHIVSVPLTNTPSVTAGIWAGVQFTSATAGLIVKDVPSVGSSHDLYFEDGVFYNFGGTPRANFALRVVDVAFYGLNVTVAGPGSVTRTPDQASYAAGATVRLDAIPSAHAHFVGWSDGLGTTNPLNVTVDANTSLTATFAYDTFTLGLTSGPGGSVAAAPPQAAYDYGTPVTVTATADPGWHFTGWSGDASGAVNPLPVTMDADKSIAASFAINTYALAVSITGSGSVSRDPDLASYTHGASVALTATAAPGWHFTGWSGDASGTANPTSVTMDAAKSVTATFVADGYTLGVSVTGSGSVARAPDQPTYAFGTGVRLTATPATGWSFTGWSGDVTGATNPVMVTMNADRAVTATFTINSYPLTVTVSGNGSVARSPNLATYPYGSSVQLTATAAAGSHFVAWSGAATGSTNPVSVTMTGAKSVTATFALDAANAGLATFESGLTGWEGYSGGILSLASPGFNSSRAAKLAAPSSGTAEFGINDSPSLVKNTGAVGTRYRVSAWVLGVTGHGKSRIRIREYNNSVNQQTVYTPLVMLGTSWQQLSVEVVIKKTGSWFDLQVLDQPVGGGESFLVDNVSVDRVSASPSREPAPAVSDGSIADGHPVVTPNPARTVATIALSMAAPGALRVEVFDVAGRAVRLLADEPHAAAGIHRFAVERAPGAQLDAGIYFYRATVAGVEHRGRFVILE